MGRLHTHNHGKAHSTRPFPLSVPKWIAVEPNKIEELIVKYRKEGLSTSQIGIKLRDQHSIPLVKPIIKNTITQVLKKNDLMPDLPEDLNNIVTKAIGLQKHLKSNKGDNRNRRSLELIEAKIHRLSTHYKKNNQIPKNWKYKSIIAQLE
ncbi:MAG: 30S ribosomal protein S15 [Candidatus Nitrosopelagicus sp.]